MANKRKFNKPILIETLDHFLDENELVPTMKVQDREPSNLSRLKYRMELIDRDQDRWEDGSMKKIDKMHINLFPRKAKSGFLKAATEEEPF